MSYDEGGSRKQTINGKSVEFNVTGPLKQSEDGFELMVSSVGSGSSIIKSSAHNSGLVELKSLVGTGAIAVTPIGDELHITSSSTTNSNIGTGQDVYVAGPNSQFKRINGSGSVQATTVSNSIVIADNKANIGTGQEIYVAGATSQFKRINGSGSVQVTTSANSIIVADNKANIGSGQEIYVPGSTSYFKRLLPANDSISISSDGSTLYFQVLSRSVQVASMNMSSLYMYGSASYSGYMEWEQNGSVSTYDPQGMLVSSQQIYAPPGWYNVSLNIVFSQDSLSSGGQTDNNSYASWTLENSSYSEVFQLGIHPAGYRETTLCRTEKVYSNGEYFSVRYNIENYTGYTCNFTFIYGKCRWAFEQIYV